MAVPVSAIDSNTGTFLGIGMNCFGSSLAACSLVIQKTTHISDSKLPEDQRKHFFCRPWWCCGVSLLGISGLMEAWSLAFTSLAVVAPLSGLTVVFNCAFSVYFLGEKTDRLEILAMAIIVSGIGFTSAFGPRNGSDFTSDQLDHMWGGCQFNADNKGPLEIITLPNGEQYENREDNLAYYDTYDCHIWIMIIFFMAVFTLWITNTYGIYKQVHRPRVHAICFASMAGSIGAVQQLFLKCFVELLYASFEGNNQFNRPQPYIYFFLVLVLIINQIYFLNKGLSYHDAVSYVPLYQALLVVYATVSGGVFFFEFGLFDTLGAAMFALGMSMVTVGLLILTLKTPPAQEGEEVPSWSGFGGIEAKESTDDVPQFKSGNEADGDGDITIQANPVHSPEVENSPEVEMSPTAAAKQKENEDLDTKLKENVIDV